MTMLLAVLACIVISQHSRGVMAVSVRSVPVSCDCHRSVCSRPPLPTGITCTCRLLRDSQTSLLDGSNHVRRACTCLMLCFLNVM